MERRRPPQLNASRFSEMLEETLEDVGFAGRLREICRPTYADEARGGRTKDGACDMVNKPEHVSDLESGVIAFNFSLLMRQLHGIGTQKQEEAAVATLIEHLSALVGPLGTPLSTLPGLERRRGLRSEPSGALRQNLRRGILTAKPARLSTGCEAAVSATGAFSAWRGI